MLTGQVSPRVVTLFEAATKDTVTTLNLCVTPATAKVDVDGVQSLPATIPDRDRRTCRHGRSARRIVASSRPLTAEVGKAVRRCPSTLERIALAREHLTVPFDVDVTIDGVKRGKTAGSPGAQSLLGHGRQRPSAGTAPRRVHARLLRPGREAAARSTSPTTSSSARSRSSQPSPISRSGRTSPARRCTSTVRRGASHRSPRPNCARAITRSSCGRRLGRYVKRVQARTGDRIAVEGTIKPALALVSIVGQPAGSPGPAPGRRARVRCVANHDALRAPGRSGRSGAPCESTACRLAGVRCQQDGPVGGTADIVQPTMKRDASTRLASTFGSQGVAAITRRGSQPRGDLAAGRRQWRPGRAGRQPRQPGLDRSRHRQARSRAGVLPPIERHCRR